MEVKVSFKGLSVLENKVLFFESNAIGITSCEILIRKANSDLFTKEELNALANTCGVTIDMFDNNKMTMYIHKSFCSVEYMPTIENRVKYLTDTIDKMSTELNKIINR